jgi:hypothetical protein
MTSHTVEHASDDPPQRLSLLPLLSGGLAVVLVVVVSLGLWPRADRGSEAPAGAGLAAAVMTDSIAQEQAAAAHASNGRTARPDPGPVLYIAGSAAQADAAQRDIDDTNTLRAALGTAPLIASVLLFPSAAAEAAFWLTRHEQETVRAGHSLDPVTVVDLRTPAAVSDPALSQRGQPARYVYLIDSEEAATAVRPLAVGADQALVVATEEDATQVRVGLTQPGTAIIDLGSPNDGARGVCRMAEPPTAC